ncbi:hypothetical protein GGH12_003193 [Coemansia sp. RSA 1822]|nr:hypothetical protein LPJ76_004222 [Coemansia sp. RSA 638]KAJ2538098.1 hypothetical protein GGF49_006105 [Coemansia sp. RSA 1853]KAJ2562499.1 hypothetical protein GGH12_003193 [Coemansia sp. RSA 1822]
MHKQISSGLLRRLSVHSGDVVAIFASNSVHYAPIVLGIISSGAVCCPVSSAFGESELEYQLHDSRASVLFVGPMQLSIVCKAQAAGRVDIPSERIVVIGEPRHSKFTSLQEMLDERPYRPCVDLKIDAMAVLVYSSGTTGLPKGVILSHRNIVACAVLNAAMFQFLNDQEPSARTDQIRGPVRSLAILPFAHIYGLTSLITNSIARGRTQYIMPDFSIDAFLQAVQDYRINTASVVPSVLAQLSAKNISKYDLSSLRLLGSGAAALPGGVHARVREQFAATTANGYGMSETCSGVCIMGSFMFTPGSVGFLLPNMEAKVVDLKTGCKRSVSEEGELCVRGPLVMMGYLNRSDETQAVIDSDGFLHTGDIGYVDARGLVFITDRIKGLIKYKGLQVAPAELESILMDHPQIADAAVIGVNDQRRHSEVPMALVVPRDLSSEIELRASIEEWVRARVADHKRLRGGVVFVAQIPRNSMGKILHRDLRAQFNTQRMAKI